MPSGNSPTQARTVNTIYWVTDDPLRPRSYDHGLAVKPGVSAAGDLLMIPGPLGLRWAGHIVPRMEGGELAWYDLPTAYRVERWLDLAPRIGNDLFIKLFAHGAQERHSSALLLEGGLDRLFSSLTEGCRQHGYQLRYVSTWEMRQAVDAAARTGASSRQ
jgi:hypothetical protein